MINLLEQNTKNISIAPFLICASRTLQIKLLKASVTSEVCEKIERHVDNLPFPERPTCIKSEDREAFSLEDRLKSFLLQQSTTRSEIPACTWNQQKGVPPSDGESWGTHRCGTENLSDTELAGWKTSRQLGVLFLVFIRYHLSRTADQCLSNNISI